MKTFSFYGEDAKYFSIIDLQQEKKEDNLLEQICQTMIFVTEDLLHIICPDISFFEIPLSIFDFKTKTTLYQDSLLLYPDFSAELQNNLILLNINLNPTEIIMNLVRQLRLLWQIFEAPDYYKSHAITLPELLLNESAIDCDAFAIYYLARVSAVPIKEIATHFLSETIKSSPSAFQLRIDRALAISTFYDQTEVIL